mmetsp:Transcript_106703/g.299822  ORF Transcript_106703/g.299822 Transcript_106703/m.299822 type:complete len:276 (-) Transcript_106703:34-861(-)
MARTALPLPFLIAVISLPAFRTRSRSSFCLGTGILRATRSCENKGSAVAPEVAPEPPTTGMSMFSIGAPVSSCTNLLARTTSSVVTPQIFIGSSPFFSYSRAMAGTTEFSGFTMMPTTASGQKRPQASTMLLAMFALIFRSSVMVRSLFGTPATTSTRWQPRKHCSKWSTGLSVASREYACTTHLLSKCRRSAPTISAGTMEIVRSYTESSATLGSMAMSRHSGFPISPAPPQTQTLNPCFGVLGTGPPTAPSKHATLPMATKKAGARPVETLEI